MRNWLIEPVTVITKSHRESRDDCLRYGGESQENDFNTNDLNVRSQINGAIIAK